MTRHRAGRLATLLAASALAAAAPAHNEHPLGREAIAWDGGAQILRTVMTNFDFHGGGNVVTWRPHGRVERRDGHECLVGPHFLFDVDDAFAFDIDETVTLEILFDRSVSDGFNLSYDHAVNPVTVERTFADGSARWHTERVILERARFANRKYEKTDFSITAPNTKFPPSSYQEGHAVAVCGITITRSGATPPPSPAGRLALTVTHADGAPAAVRAGLYAPDGKAPLAGASAVEILRFGERLRDLPLRTAPRAWPGEGRFVFYVDGAYAAAVPAGEYTLVLAKGPEYRLDVRPVTIVAGETVGVDVVLERWRDLPAEGWYSGDDHIHVARHDPSVNAQVSAYTRAEDVHVANLLQMANVTTWHFPQYAFGARGHHVEGSHALVPGQESPRTSHRGHSIGLNAKCFHWPGEDYFLYDRTARAIRADGGLWGYAHVAIDAFNVAWGLALDVPLGYVDFFEMLQMGAMNTSYLYDFLNLGFRVLPSAGSDYPYIHVAGSERVYVHLDGPFSVPAWFDAWRTGRAFVSNGPVLEFTVNGDGEAQTLAVAAGTPLAIVARATLNPDVDRLDRLELVVHGDVVARVQADASGAEVLSLNHTLSADAPLWFALRAYGRGTAKAHTAAVVVTVDGDSRFHDRENVAAIATKYRDLLTALRRSTPTLDEEWERFNVEGDVLSKWRDDKPALDERIDRAYGLYQLLIDEARGGQPVGAR